LKRRVTLRSAFVVTADSVDRKERRVSVESMAHRVALAALDGRAADLLARELPTLILRVVRLDLVGGKYEGFSRRLVRGSERLGTVFETVGALNARLVSSNCSSK
jgi:hypothetical protein